MLLTVFQCAEYRFILVEKPKSAKNIWEPVIEDIILGFLMADTSSNDKKYTYFVKYVTFLLYIEPLPFTSYRSCTPANNFECTKQAYEYQILFHFKAPVIGFDFCKQCHHYKKMVGVCFLIKDISIRSHRKLFSYQEIKNSVSSHNKQRNERKHLIMH